MFQDSARTTPAVVDGPVGYLADKSGNGNHATQATSSKRPTLRQVGSFFYLEFDGVDDGLTIGDGTALSSNVSTIAQAVRKIAGNVLIPSIVLVKQVVYLSLDTANWLVYNNAVVRSTYNVLTASTIVARIRAANDVDLFTNNNALEHFTNGTSFNTRTSAIGFEGTSFGSFHFYGGIVVLSALEDQAIAKMKTWLAPKYGGTL